MEVTLFQLIVLLIPNQFSKHFWPDSSLISGIRVDYLSPTIYFNDLLIFLLLLVSIYKNGKRWRMLFVRNRKWFAVLIGAAILNIFVAINIYTAIYSWIRLFEFLMLSGVIYVSRDIKYKHVYIPLFIALTYSFVIAVWQFITKSTIGGLFYFLGERSFNIYTLGIAKWYVNGHQFLRPYATFSHPNSLASFAVVTLLLLFNSKKSVAKKITLLIVSMILLLTNSLNAWLAMFMSIFVFLIYRKILVYTPLLFLIFSLVSSFFLLSNYPTLGFGQSIDERIYLLNHTAAVTSSNFFEGVGLGNFIYTLDKNSGPSVGGVFLQPVHNVYLLILSETGIIISAILFSLLVFVYKNILTNKYASAIFMFILISSLFDHYWLTIHQNQLLLSILFGYWSKQTKA